MSNTSTIHIKTDFDCKVFDYGQELGTTQADTYFNVELRKGEHELTFAFTEDESISKTINYTVADADCDYRLIIEMADVFEMALEIEEDFDFCVSEVCADEEDLYDSEDYDFCTDEEESYDFENYESQEERAIAQVERGDICYKRANNRIIKFGKQDPFAAQLFIRAAENFEKAERVTIWSDYDSAIDSYYKAGYSFEKGNGVERNLSKAMKWYSLSAKNGNKDAQQAVDRLKQDGVRLMKYLFFDTETTGIPIDYNAPTSDSRNWPRLVQLSWMTTDEDCNVLSQNDFIIYPDGFTIPSDASKLHGITTAIAKKKGKPLKEVMDKFMEDFKVAKAIVGHNITFDKKIVGAELIRLGQKDNMNSKESICTMEASTDFCKIPGYYGYKWPKLQELHKKLFGHEFEDAHNSMSDVKATLKCFKEMKKLGWI